MMTTAPDEALEKALNELLPYASEAQIEQILSAVRLIRICMEKYRDLERAYDDALEENRQLNRCLSDSIQRRREERRVSYD